MTNITFYLDDNDLCFGFEAKGHAGYGKYGSDIVCSAISVLTLNTVNSFTELLHSEVTFKGDDKTGDMEFKVTDYDNDSAQLLFRSLKLGLEGVHESYPKFMNISNRRCRP